MDAAEDLAALRVRSLDDLRAHGSHTSWFPGSRAPASTTNLDHDDIVLLPRDVREVGLSLRLGCRYLFRGLRLADEHRRWACDDRDVSGVSREGSLPPLMSLTQSPGGCYL